MGENLDHGPIEEGNAIDFGEVDGSALRGAGAHKATEYVLEISSVGNGGEIEEVRLVLAIVVKLTPITRL